MKKSLILIAALMILPAILSATQMNVVGEVFTATSCQYCPSARTGLRDLAANFDNFIPLFWQSTSGFVGMPSPNYSTRGTMYGVSTIPHARFGGYIYEIGGIPVGSMYSDYLPHYYTLNALDSPLAIDITMDVLTKSTVDIQADAEVTSGITTTNNKLILLLTNKYNYDYTAAVVAYYEENFSLTTIGQTENFTHSFTFDPSWDVSNLKAVAIVQTFSGNLMILQAATCGVYALLPMFSSDVQSGPPELGIQFYNESCPSTGIISYEWDFDNDGTWDSTEENPYYIYENFGTYDVTLRISDGIEYATITMEDFITVLSPSNVSGNAAGTWSPTYGTYTVTGDVTVPSGTILAIEPNTNIIVNNGSNIKVKGKIEAVGSERGFVNFSTDDTWEGLLIQDTQELNIIDYCYFTGATSSAVSIDNSVANILNSVFYENTNTSQKGPAINVLDASDVLIEGNTIANNFSSVLSGGIVLDNAAVEISHNIIVNNEATFAGAIGMKNGSDASLINNTIANNIGSYACIYILSSYPNVLNTIIIHDGLIFTTFSGNPTVNYTCISGGYSGTGNIDVDPQFVNPTAGDGNAYDGLLADWSLQETSPCIDTGDPSSPPDPDGTIADMGALYYHQVISVDDPHNNMIYIRQNAPNPFKGSTSISYSLPKNSENAVITIYNVKGDVVKEFTLEDTEGDVVWNGFDQNDKAVASGVYFYRLQGDSISQTRTMTFMK